MHEFEFCSYTAVFPVARERNENRRCKRKDCSNIQTRDMMSIISSFDINIEGDMYIFCIFRSL